MPCARPAPPDPATTAPLSPNLERHGERRRAPSGPKMERPASRSGGGLPLLRRGALHEHRNRIGQFGALTGPIRDAIVRNPKAFFLLGRHRVIEADALDEPPVAPIARIRDHNVIERTLFGAAARQSDDDHELSEFRPKKTRNYSLKCAAAAFAPPPRESQPFASVGDRHLRRRAAPEAQIAPLWGQRACLFRVGAVTSRAACPACRASSSARRPS